LRAALLAFVALASCTPASLPDVSAPTHLEDPGAPTPEARSFGTTGVPVALLVRSPHEEVLEHVIETLTALVDGDRARLERLLAASLVRASPSVGHSARSRAAVLAIALNPSRRKGITPGLPLDRLVVVDELRVVPIDSVKSGALPAGIEPSDVAVLVPLTIDGSSIFRAMLPGWADTGQIVVGTKTPLLVKGL
jgi:hypothetical protein